MNFSNTIAILLSGASIAIGAILGVLRSKIFSSKNANNLYWIFYGFAIVVFISAVIGGIVFRKELFVDVSWFGICVLAAAVISSVSLFFISKRHLVIKDTYEIPELDPIINDFTSLADKDEIKLFGGDFSFLGNDPLTIDKHPQYIHLKSSGFTKISILCETPTTPIQQMRYGKMLYEMPGVELRFYNPTRADLKVRGRIIQVQGVSKLLMYTKLNTGTYKAIATDTADTNGALYNNIWELIWSLAIILPPEMKQSYIKAFRGGDVP